MNDAPRTDETGEQYPEITELSPRQRRVLGVLVEKALTTPEYYPMTLKAVTAGCNQKSNRDPVVQYDEDQAAEALEQLRSLGLVAVVHTETGRTERYRHYVRKRFTFSEPQLAIFTELLLRGRQTLGDLRGRASRMVPIESLDGLRTELQGLLDMRLVQATGPLERRGVEVDHDLYQPREARTLEAAPPDDHPPSAEPAPRGSAPVRGEPSAVLMQQIDELRRDHQELRSHIETLQEQMRDLTTRVDELRRDLGG
ncbi:MAG: DUF480 domain-containing protein [Planctomycetaceae bacterium]